MDIADYLVQKIAGMGINQSEFARRSGLTTGPVSKWITRGGKPDLESCLKIAAFFREDPVKILNLSGREELIALYRKFDPQHARANVSEEDLYEDETHRQLHRGLQRVLERGMERPHDVELGFELVRRSLDALLGSEKLFRSLIETAQVIAWEATTAELCFTYVAPQAEAILGYPQESWYEKEFWHQHLHAEDRDRAILQRIRAVKTGESYELEYRMVSPTGRVRWFQEAGNLVSGSASSSTLQGFLFDITPRKKAEQGLRESEERYRSLVELCPDAIVVHRNGEILYVNPAGVKLHGVSSLEELTGRSVYEFVRSEDLIQVQERIRQNVEEGITMPLVEQEIVSLNGERILVEVAAAPISYQGEAAVQSILRVISQRRDTNGSGMEGDGAERSFTSP